MLGLGGHASAATYTWTGGAGDGLWQSGAVDSYANWLVDGVAGNYAPGNGGTNNYVFADPAYSTGPTTITIKNDPNAGNLQFNGNSTTPLNLVIDGGRLDFTAATNGVEVLNVTASAATGHEISAINGGKIQLQTNDEHTWRISGSAVLTVSAPIEGSGVRRGIVKRGGGTLRLTGENTMSGQLQVIDGAVEVGSLRNMGLTSAAGTGTRYGTIQVGGTNGLAGRLTYIGADDTTTDQRFNIGRSTASEPPATQTNRLLNNGGTLTLTGGIVANEGGIPTFNVGLEIGGDGDINVDARGADRTYFADREGGIFGGINLNKVGAGTVRINADSLWRGSTTVTAGTLLVNINHPINNAVSAYTVQSGGTLGGTGGVTSPISVLAGGQVRPGDAGGTLDVSTLSLDGIFVADLLSTSTFGQLLSTGTVSLGSEATLAIGSVGELVVGDMFTIIDTPGSLLGTFAGLTDGASFTSGLNTYEIGYANGDVTLTVTDVVAVPEPATIGLLSVVGLALLRRRRAR